MHYPDEISILLKECVKNTDKYADLKVILLLFFLSKLVRQLDEFS